VTGVKVVETGLPIVHDEVDAIPEGEAVGAVDDKPSKAAADSSLHKPTYYGQAGQLLKASRVPTR
jgi:hypothetical protein